MSVKSDTWIRKMAKNHKMIHPFEPAQVKERGGLPRISSGVSSYGYDLRVGRVFKVFTNLDAAVIDPKNFDHKS